MFRYSCLVTLFLSLQLVLLPLLPICFGRQHVSVSLPTFRPSRWTGDSHNLPVESIRGGYLDDQKPAESSIVVDDIKNDDDEERYSRQVYALGSRAHGLIRSSTVVLDGPPESGLLFETAKNLALSGVRRIILLESYHEMDAAYFDGSLDDLGRAYLRAARQEVGDTQNTLEPMQVLKEYIQRLNPSVSVTVVPRRDLATEMEHCQTSDKKVILVAVDRPLSTQMTLNSECRQLDIAFCAAGTAGVFGIVFCDFGDDFVVHDVDGETPLATPLDKIVGDDDCGKLTVHCVDGEKHDVSKGDLIQFKFRDGSLLHDLCRVENVFTPIRFQIRIDSHQDVEAFCGQINLRAATFSRVKQPLTLKYQPLQKALANAKADDSLFTACDLEKSFDTVRRTATVAFFTALSSFTGENGRLPKQEERKRFWNLAKAGMEELLDRDQKQVKRHCKHFFRGCAAKFVPMQAIFGAIAAQEALKAVSGLYNPVHQFLLYDCDEVLHGAKKSGDGANADSECAVPGNLPGLRALLGNVAVNTLNAQKIFVVGAGAIGCELLKNLAALGVATGDGASIHVTDMDTIEKSNLSRQFLFRDTDIGAFKSAAAQQAVLQFNPSMKIQSHFSKVGDSTHGPFDEDFWSTKVDVVLNALDNLDARLFIDRQCVAYHKALVDSGTLGPKGNVQVVIPHQSESYASSADPPDQAIPVCTLKNFPYSISHTIQWGRDLFDGLFQSRPTQANAFLEALKRCPIDKLVEDFAADQGAESRLRIFSELSEDMKRIEEDFVRQSCLEWAAQLSHALYYQSAVDLLAKHPLDSVDEDGQSFWTGIRRPPLPLLYKDLLSDNVDDDKDQHRINDNLIHFVKTAARLRMETIHSNLTAAISEDDARNALLSNESLRNEGGSSLEASLESYEYDMRNMTCRTEGLDILEFEKDDDTNGHVEFVSASSNLRAISYGIPPVDTMETRRVAGNIIPAMITTTAFVAALSCLELVKLSQGSSLHYHRNAFINLALPFFAFTSPLPAEEVSGLAGKTFTIWDRLTFIENLNDAETGGLSVRSLVKQIETELSAGNNSVTVSSISIGEYMLYANFLHENDEDVLDANLWNHIVNSFAVDEDFAGRTSDQTFAGIAYDRYVDLSVSVEDRETGTEVELPPVRVQRYTPNTSSEACSEDATVL